MEKDLPAEIADYYDAIVEKVAALRLNARQTIASVKKEQDELAILKKGRFSEADGRGD